jgi:hypothetical protein
VAFKGKIGMNAYFANRSPAPLIIKLIIFLRHLKNRKKSTTRIAYKKGLKSKPKIKTKKKALASF